MAGQWQMQLGDHLNASGGWAARITLWFLPAPDGGSADPGLCQQARLPRLALLGPALAWPLIGGSYGRCCRGQWALLTRNSSPLLFVALAPSCACVPGSRTPGAALMMMAGMGLCALEALGLLRVAAVPSLVMISCWVRSPGRWGCSACCWPAGMGQGSWLERQAPKVLGLYCLHDDAGGVADDLRPPGQTGVWWELLGYPRCWRSLCSATDCWRPPPSAAGCCGLARNRTDQPADQRGSSAKSCICWKQGIRATPKGAQAVLHPGRYVRGRRCG